MQNEISKTINVQVLDKEVVPINNFKIAVLEKDNDNLVVRPLVQTSDTVKENSLGIVESGKYLAIKLKKNVANLNVECYINDYKVNYEQIYSDDKYIIIKIKLDEKMKNTIKSWNYLRNEMDNYFNIDFSKVGERIYNPNVLKLICNSNYSQTCKFDNIDKYSNNINYLFENDVININDVKSIKSLKEWMLDEQ